MRKIIQFGDELKDLFIFTPFEEEEDWGDSVTPSVVPLTNGDGGYRVLGFDQAPKPPKTITKRFQLYSDELLTYFIKSNRRGVCTDNNCDDLKQAYMTDLVDYLYRGLRGGVKKLYAVMEDGSIRYTLAEAISIPYQKSYGSSMLWNPFFIDFLLHDPYWYEVNDGEVFLYKDIPFFDLVCSCTKIKEVRNIMPSEMIGWNSETCLNGCNYQGVILRDADLKGYVGGGCIVEESCTCDPCYWADSGEGFVVNGTTTVEVCVNGSAGATSPTIGFRGLFTNPKLTNLKNDCEVAYNGNIGADEYLIINLNILNGEVEDMTIDTNIVGFSVTDLSVNNDGFFNLEKGINNLKVEGGTAINSVFSIKFKNKYHN